MHLTTVLRKCQLVTLRYALLWLAYLPGTGGSQYLPVTLRHFSFIFSKCPKHFKVLYFIISTIPYFIQPDKTIFPHTHSLFSLSSILFIAQPPFKMTSFHCWDPSSRPFALFHIQVPFAYASVSTVMLSGSILFFFFHSDITSLSSPVELALLSLPPCLYTWMEPRY